jgi:hypothetical protein
MQFGVQGEQIKKIIMKKRIHSSSAAQDREQEADWIAKGALVAFIYFGGFYTMISAIMSNIMG